ncbi:uncharacterized protein LOC106169183 [Lingula anatina]|uniref:Uncharacterized protein LOC106169183 n=1 Tax=Lingula anatina TaxID=7574 RepID=A0A1S3J0P8_LINAN|nr:uncharacterized protein LOC106169183 [Lingula anatina]|eukprot:XP_013404017.1 uncharacterized protein LOC106169183 [Lingula anatina]
MIFTAWTCPHLSGHCCTHGVPQLAGETSTQPLALVILCIYLVAEEIEEDLITQTMKSIVIKCKYLILKTIHGMSQVVQETFLHLDGGVTQHLYIKISCIYSVVTMVW